ncbi:MAG: LexA family transcriptional regulator [Rhodospirillales bacterium]|nr:LexA family transcriptional regulator [Rhodospirillales bacterium]MCB9994841.1 LexA family transcriptional regulator [Rhodospirillales bacterium]
MVKKSAKNTPSNGRESKAGREVGHEWIKHRIDALKKTQKEVALALGMPAPRLSERIKGKAKFEPAEIPVLARELKMSFPVVFAKITGMTSSEMNDNLVILEIRGVAKAGEWNKAPEWPASVWEYIMVARNTDYSEVYGLRITGDDMEEYYPPARSTVMCVPYAHYNEEVRNGAHVIVQRSDGNGQYETTVKQVQIEDGHIWLKPCSKNPAYKPIEMLRTDGSSDYYGTSDLKITGVVLNAIIDQTPPKTTENCTALPTTL